MISELVEKFLYDYRTKMTWATWQIEIEINSCIRVDFYRGKSGVFGDAYEILSLALAAFI